MSSQHKVRYDSFEFIADGQKRFGTTAKCGCGWSDSYRAQDGSAEMAGHHHMSGGV